MPRSTGPLGDDVNHVRSGSDVGLARHMSITLQSGTPASLDEVVEAVASWQREGGPVQVHPGDFGWNWSFGSEALAREVRVWRREGQIMAAGMVDRKEGLIRMAIAPSVDA